MIGNPSPHLPQTISKHPVTNVSLTRDDGAALSVSKMETNLFFQELPLYCSGGLRFFWDNKFDHAMVAFLDCVQQFKEEVEKGETRFCLPYR